jgi:hypothetical protein
MKHIAAVVVIAVGCSASEEIETFDLVANNGPAITSVTTVDGFTQIRQNVPPDNPTVLVIRGKRLGRTTSVDVSLHITTLDSVSARELRVTLLPIGNTPGPLDVTVTARNGTAVMPGALELTPFVVSPTAVTGRGTFESPMNICDPAMNDTGFGSTVLLLAGTHHCDRGVFIGGDSIVLGDPDHGTILTGTDTGGIALSVGGGGSTTTIRDLTFVPPLRDFSIFSEGEVIVERVVDVGGIMHSNGMLRLDHYTYEGEGTALDVSGADIRNSTIRHCGAGDGIFAHGTNGEFVRLDGVVVEDCEVGLRGIGALFTRIPIIIANSQLIDNGIALSFNDTSTSVQNVVIRDDESTPRAGHVGIMAGPGGLGMADVDILGQEQVGLIISHSEADHRAAVVFADGLRITGGVLGIHFLGIDNQLTMRNSIIRDQTQAALLVSNIDGVTNLGTVGNPGNNQLSVVSGFVIDDTRQAESANRYIRAHGTTLNGVSFDGQTIDGGAELAPFYRLAGSHSGIQF